MGTKQRIAAQVAASIKGVRPEKPLMDLFCGMCAVAGEVSADARPVWGNDVQAYAALAASCLIAHRPLPPRVAAAFEAIGDDVDRNREALARRFRRELAEEARSLECPSVEDWSSATHNWAHAGNCETIASEVAGLAKARLSFPYRLATLTFAWGYFGLQQAIDIDSLRYGIDQAHSRNDVSDEGRDWMVLALVETASGVSSTTGHTAQYIRPANAASLRRVLRQRRRDVKSVFADRLQTATPFGTPEWRAKNRVFAGDALSLWPTLKRSGLSGAVFYADPPYTKNQYSRFYHVLETLTRYDYPTSSGLGRYRPDRFRTPFSTRAGVVGAFTDLCSSVAELDGALVLSYPKNGMLWRHRGVRTEDLLRDHFSRVERVLEEPMQHSTLGARHGHRDSSAIEQVWLAQ